MSLQEANYGQQLYRAAEDSFRQGNRDRYEKLQKWLKSIGAGYSVKGFDPILTVYICSVAKFKDMLENG